MSQSKPKPACFFCEATDRPLTNEHLWSAWLEKILPNRGPITYYRANALKGEEPTENRWRGKDFDHTVKAVCEPCNGGWMNQVEIKARPFLESLIHGHGRNLYRDGQRKVATWGAMKAMLFQAKDRDAPIPLSHRRQLYTERTPPERCQVWIGCYTGKVWVQRYFGLTFDEPGQPSIPAYAATFATNYLVFQVFGHEAGRPMRREIRGQLAESFV